MILTSPLLAQSTGPRAAPLPLSWLGEIPETQRRIVFNSLLDQLSRTFILVPQEQVESAKEAAFMELPDKECTEENCLRFILERLNVSHLFGLQLVREAADTQITLTWIENEKRSVRADYCEACSTRELLKRTVMLVDEILAGHELIAFDQKLDQVFTEAANPPLTRQAGLAVQTQKFMTKVNQFSTGKPMVGTGISPNGKRLYAPLWEDGNGGRVLEYSLPDLSLQQVFSFGDMHPHGGAVVSEDGYRFFVNNYSQHTVSQIELDNANARTDLSTVDSWPSRIDITPDRKKVLVSAGADGRDYDMNNDSLVVYDISNNNFTMLASIKLPDEILRGVSVSQDSRFVYAATMKRKSSSHQLYEISLENIKISRQMDFQEASSWLGQTTVMGDTVYVTENGKKLWTVNRKTWTKKLLKQFDEDVNFVEVHPQGKYLFVRLRTALLAFERESMKEMERFELPLSQVGDIQFAPDGKQMYVSSNTVGGEIYVFALNFPEEETETRGKGQSKSAEWELIYETDFSSDPKWRTNNPDNYHWDQKNEEFYARVVNSSMEYATVNIPSWKGKSFKISYDQNMEYDEWSAGVLLGLFDMDKSYSNSNAAWIEFGRTSWGRGIAMLVYDDDDVTGSHKRKDIYRGEQTAGTVDNENYNNGFNLNIWYRIVIEYDQPSEVISYEITLRENDELLYAGTLSDVGQFGEDMVFLGTTRIPFMYEVHEAIGKFDNIKFYVR